MSNLDDRAGGNSFLTISGDVEVGIELKGTDFESSIKRGGDGYAAEFRGGYLDAGQGSKGELNISGKEMSLCVRLIDPSGDWGAPIVAKYGSGNKMLYRLYTEQINDNMMLIFGLGIDSDDTPGPMTRRSFSGSPSMARHSRSCACMATARSSMVGGSIDTNLSNSRRSLRARSLR